MSEPTICEKTIRGWRVATQVKINEELELEVVTMKRDKGPATTATVTRREGAFKVHKMYRDFTKWLTTHDSIRWTEAEARKKHQVALEAVGGLQAVVNEAKQHYNIV